VIRELRFIAMSRQCGFSLAQIAEVLPAYRCKTLTASQIVCRLEERIAESMPKSPARALRSTWFHISHGFASASRSQPRSQDFRVFVRAAMMPVHPAGGSKS
jgi:DNA-binding transcriptional MerR regulator